MVVMQSFVDALSLGALFGLEALGVGLVFGIVRLANFALGAVIMVCGYTLYLTSDAPLVLMLIAAVVAGVVTSLLTEWIVFRPLRRRAREATLFIASFALSFGLQNAALLTFGARPKALVVSSWLGSAFSVHGIVISHLSVVTLILVSVLLAGVVVLLRTTDIGIRMRAASDDFAMARLLGVQADRVIGLAFVLSGVLSAAAAVIVVAQTGGVSPGIGTNIIIFALLGAVIGGMDRLVGATVGGFATGFAISMMSSWLPLGTRPYRDAFVAIAVILVLLLRPEGLLPGGTLRERV